MTSASSSYSDPAVTVKSSSPGGSSTRAGAPALDQTAEQTEQAEQGDDSSTASSIVPASDFTYSAPPSEVSEYDNDLRSLPGRAEKEAMRKGKERPSRRAQDSASSLSGSPCEDDGSQENDRGVGEGEKIEGISADFGKALPSSNDPKSASAPVARRRRAKSPPEEPGGVEIPPSTVRRLKRGYTEGAMGMDSAEKILRRS
eukprot:jgi/Undpi1/8595/HiC_scaffold_25.g11060.m1